MPWVVIAAGDVDAKSPVSDSLTGDIKNDLDYLKSTLTDGASAPQDLTVNKVTLKGTGTAFQLDNDGNVDGDFAVAGTLSTGVFFSSEQLLSLYY